MNPVSILHPASGFAGVVVDDEGRGWLLQVAPTTVPKWVHVFARRGTHAFCGNYVVGQGYFDGLTPEHGQSGAFIWRIAEHLRLLTGLVDSHDLPLRGAYLVLAHAKRAVAVA